ncbi:putative polycomb protein, VEFS-Box [Helianthus annuus]|nr:putative polycomb protein, VEFS-Box [Helianthus annuus]
MVRALLLKRQFFHSHRAQRDSEDEADDDMLDDFVDVSKDEKQMMHLWNSFVRKQRFNVLLSPKKVNNNSKLDH